MGLIVGRDHAGCTMIVVSIEVYPRRSPVIIRSLVPPPIVERSIHRLPGISEGYDAKLIAPLLG